MFDIFLHAMIYAVKGKKKYKLYDNYCTTHKVVSQETYNVCKDCEWKQYCSTSVGTLK